MRQYRPRPSPSPGPSATNIGSASAAANTFPLTVKDSGGTAVTLPAAAQRIVSFSPAATEVLFAIGAGNQVVGVDKFSDYPAATSSLPKLEYEKPAPEPTLALNPDLVIMATEQEGEAPQFRSLGMRVLLLEEPADLAGIYNQIDLLGQLTGHSADADALDASMKSRIDAIAARLKGIATGPSVYYEITQDGFTVGPHSFIGSLLDLAKAKNIASGATTDFPQLSAEAIIAANPDVILLTDSGDFGGNA